MKKLTAGIFAGILTVVGVSAADAAITSKKYVDDALDLKADASALADVETTANAALPKSEFTTFQTSNTSAIADAKKAGTDAATALDTYKGEVTTALGAKQNTLQAASITGNDATGNVITGITANNGVITVTKAKVATAEGLEELEGRVDTAESDITTLKSGVANNKSAIDILNGSAETAGSLAKAIADEVKRSNEYADQAEADAKSYADGLGVNYATAAQGAKADTAVQPAAIADMETKTNATATYATKTALTDGLNAKQNKLTNVVNGSTNVVIDDETGKISLTGIATDANLTTLEGKVDANTAAIDTKQAKLDETQMAAVNSSITGAKVTALNELTVHGNIPSVCTGKDATAGCALIYKGDKFEWEVIERVEGE